MIDWIKPKIFDDNKIIAGVTKRNLSSYFPYGFTISQAQIAGREEVLRNRNLLAEELGIKSNLMIFQKQVHGDVIRKVSKGDDNNAETDGMITTEKGVILNISIADCAGVLIWDSVNDIICGIHSGWKGTSLNIVGKGIQKLIDEFESKSENLYVYISPCAGGNAYEVGEEVAKFFPRSIKLKSRNKYLFDNKNEILHQLLDMKIPIANIEISDICTISDENFHSYRRDADFSGRMSAFIGMRI
ncbi:MAG: peptidoglycan editing factor PgeF [Candidatus Kapabacteria bacterium]|nr:peptidoglycan editing factor PgeF [Ignavibacteriota bacterium]MCW5886370.1 peptidoglycan editing factor PgeF [Candidatus Kapabacteria bacterium]